MKKYILLSCLLAAIVFYTCDKVKNPYVISHNSAAGCPPPVFPAKTPLRKVLIEDYTGHECNNCPAAGINLEAVRSPNAAQVIVLSVHANYDAWIPAWGHPAPGGTSPGAFDHYLGCPAGENLFSQPVFNMNGWPTFMVNRMMIQGSQLTLGTASTWQSVVDTAITNNKTTPAADINIVTSYDPSTRKLCVACKTTFLKSMAGTYNLSVFFVEDSIVDWQTGQSNSGPGFTAGNNYIDSTYLFRYVLRDDIANGAGNYGVGPVIANNPIAGKDTVVSRSYIVPTGYAFTTDTWSHYASAPASASPCNYKHCYVLAFVYYNTGGNNPYGEIIQPEMKSILP